MKIGRGRTTNVSDLGESNSLSLAIARMPIPQLEKIEREKEIVEERKRDQEIQKRDKEGLSD